MVDQPSEETESLEREWPNTYAAYFYRLDPLEAETWEHELVSGRNKLKPPPTDSEVRDAISYIAAQGPARGPKLKAIIESIRMLRDRPELNIERESCLACRGNGYLAFPVSENPEDKKDWRFGMAYAIENKWRSNGSKCCANRQRQDIT